MSTSSNALTLRLKAIHAAKRSGKTDALVTLMNEPLETVWDAETMIDAFGLSLKTIEAFNEFRDSAKYVGEVGISIDARELLQKLAPRLLKLIRDGSYTKAMRLLGPLSANFHTRVVLARAVMALDGAADTLAPFADMKPALEALEESEDYAQKIYAECRAEAQDAFHASPGAPLKWKGNSPQRQKIYDDVWNELIAKDVSAEANLATQLPREETRAIHEAHDLAEQAFKEFGK